MIHAAEIIGLIGVVVAVITLFMTAKWNRDATETQTYRECVHATLQDFAELRRTHHPRLLEMEHMKPEEKEQIINNYLADLERFAVGCNLKAYDLEVINRMSGGRLLMQYREFLKAFIENKRRILNPSSLIKSENLYIEVELMMKRLSEVRNTPFSGVENYPEDERILERFLSLPIDSTEGVFSIFRTLPNAVENHKDGKKRYLYVPGTRKDRCLLVAHADTYFDTEYQNQKYENSVVLEKGKYHGTSTVASIGADDRSGCAILWLLRDSGHSLLLLDGEEHGQIGSHYLKEEYPELFNELNEHSFILQFDRGGNNNYRYYDIPVTEEFKQYIEKETGYEAITGNRKTDIIVLCDRICGANLSVGYYCEHRAEEYLVISEWKNTLSIARRMLDKPLKKYSVRA